MTKDNFPGNPQIFNVKGNNASKNYTREENEFYF